MKDLDTKIQNIPNTFAPRVKNQMFSIDMIIHGLRFGFLKMSILPPDIRKKVNDVLESKKRDQAVQTNFSISFMILMDKEDTVRDIVNDFMPDCVNKTFNVGELIFGIKKGFFKLDDLPVKIRERVDMEMERRTRLYGNSFLTESQIRQENELKTL